MKKIKLKSLRKAVKSKGYRFFDKGDYNLNIVGVRTEKFKLDKFNDKLVVAYKSNGKWKLKDYTITTYPGLTFLGEKFFNDALGGTAILIPGQHLGCYKIGKHWGYEALCQKSGNKHRVRVWRDNTLDAIPNPDKTYEFRASGINIHRSRPNSCATKIGEWSAGCQVFRCEDDFFEFMKIVRKGRDQHGNSFTYTLLEEADFT